MTDSRADYEKETREAFERALSSGRLSHDKSAYNYVGNHWMYMGPRADGRGDSFKHSLTREHLA